MCAFLASDVYFFAVEPVLFGREVVPPDDFFSETAFDGLFFDTVRTEAVFFTVAFGLLVEDFFVVGLVVFVAGLVFCML